MSANEYLVDVFTRHQIFLERFSAGEAKRLNLMLDRMAADVGANIYSVGEDDIASANLARLLGLVRETVDTSMEDLSEATVEQIIEFGKYEAEFTQKALQTAASTTIMMPSDSLIIAALRDSPMTLVTGKKTETLSMEDMFKAFTRKKQSEISNIIRTGATTGMTGPEIAREVKRVVKTRTATQAEAIVRTSINHISTQAKDITFQANPKTIKGLEWISILDGRTTLTCAGRDGKLYPIDSGPRPPAHYRCRSLMVAALIPKYQRKALDGERKAGDGKVVNSQTTYNSWLKRQPKNMQNEVLGKERAKLFRSGGLSVSKFTDPRGVVYSLEELKRLEPLAFDRAGLL